MKNITEYLNEAINESQWKSKSGLFNNDHAEKIQKEWGQPLKDVYAVLDDWDETFGGQVEWEVKDGGLEFSNPDKKKRWIYDLNNKNWKEIKF